ncbi:MAG: SirB2 family protein [Sporocytophaga sp.]|uniref:SirB2 family protein n=1 Tax=Sporocytophaga sp. TaxID=2231183 RepID=UPI001B04C895|nr:SirB2 family protein [Sporocytophaga sp.]MBO9701954.1 SirB2 family protein [Sporocytophaga sp.]
MDKGFLHTHNLVVVIFLITFIIKTVLLLLNKYEQLDKIREKTKVLEMIMGTLILITGGYLLYATKNTQPYIIAKIVIVLACIPLGIVGLKKKNKALTVIALLGFLYVLGIALTKSLTLTKQKIEVPASVSEESSAASEEIIQENADNGLRNAKAIFEKECARCHGVDGKQGLAGAKDLTVSQLTDAEKKEMILKGKGLMAGYEGRLTEQEVDNLVLYVNTLKK